MRNKKLLYIGLILIVFLAYISFSGFFEESSNINIYTDGSIIKESLKLAQKDTIPLPNNVVSNSLYIKPEGAELVSAEIKKTGELEGNIGKHVKVFFKDKEYEGTLIDVKGKLYLKTDDGILVVSPDAYVLEKAESTTQANVVFNSKPTNVLLLYMTSGIKWNTNHKVFLDNGKARVETFGIISNNDDKEYSGEVELISDSLGIGSIPLPYPTYYRNNLYEAKGIMGEGNVYVEQVRKEKTVKYKLGQRSFSPKSTNIIKIDEGTEDYKRTLLYNIEGNYNYIDETSETKLINTISFKAPHDMAGGEVYVYGETFEGKTSIPNKAKGEEVKLNLGENFYVTGKVKVLDFKQYGKNNNIKEIEREITVKNNGDTAYDIEVIIDMPLYAKWSVISSNESYETTKSKVIYKFNLPQGEEKKIDLKVRIEYG